MKIFVEEQGITKVNLHLPTGLLLNRFTALFAPRAMKSQDGPELTAQQAWRLMKTLKDYKAAHPEWVIVEVHSANGEHVEISL